VVKFKDWVKAEEETENSPLDIFSELRISKGTFEQNQVSKLQHEVKEWSHIMQALKIREMMPNATNDDIYQALRASSDWKGSIHEASTAADGVSRFALKGGLLHR